jgi:2,3-bisphosphoglycerate-independent phosphoglycerate mutase
MKYVILHADGLYDVPRSELGGRTPLQSAMTPNLDRVAQSGDLGLVTVPSDGSAHSGSEATGMAVLGYDPRKYYTGPAPLEAAGLGVNVGEHDVVFCCTMVTLRGESPHNEGARDLEVKKLAPHLIMEDATAGFIDTEQARELIETMNEQLGSETIQFYPGTGHRHLMVWVGGKARSACADPQHALGRPVGEYLPQGDGAETLRKLMDASIVILRDHPVNEERRIEGHRPANCLWLWGQGRASEWPPLAERYAVTGAVIAASDVHRGIGICAGLNTPDLSSEPDGAHAPYGAYCEAVRREVRRHDVLYIHTGLYDVHCGSDVKKKVQAIEAYDRDLMGPLLRILEQQEPFCLLVLCEAGSSANYGRSSGAPVYAMCEGPLRERSAGKRFNEADASADGAPPREATKLLARLLSRGA